MEKIITILSIIFIAVTACDRDDTFFNNTCSVSNPTEDLDWLQSEIQKRQEHESDSELTQYFFISQTFYEEETVFIFDNCCPFCNAIVSVKNCAGETIGHVGYEDTSVDIRDNAEIIWKPNNFACKN